jgi:hypothetical protein
MAWKKVYKDKTMFLHFEANKSFEGVYLGYNTRDNPFFKANEPETRQNCPFIYDYRLEIEGEEKILSSTAESLKRQLMELDPNTKVKIDCKQAGVKKFYDVWVTD